MIIILFLHPQLPEQYRIDPPSLESKHHHKRKKHKRKPIEKAAEDGGDMGPPAAKAKMPSDAFNFIKHEPPHSHYPPPPSQLGHAFSGSPMVQTTSVIQHSFSTSMGGGRSLSPSPSFPLSLFLPLCLPHSLLTFSKLTFFSH